MHELDAFKVVPQSVSLEARITELVSVGNFRDAAALEHGQAERAHAIGETEFALSCLDVAHHLRVKSLELLADEPVVDQAEFSTIQKERILDDVLAYKIARRANRTLGETEQLDANSYLDRAKQTNASLGLSGDHLDIDELIDERTPEQKERERLQATQIGVLAVIDVQNPELTKSVIYYAQEAPRVLDHTTKNGVHRYITDSHKHRQLAGAIVKHGEAVAVTQNTQNKIIENRDGKPYYWDNTEKNVQMLEAKGVKVVGQLS